MKNIINRKKLKTEHFNVDWLICNKQYPVVLYIYDDEITHSNLEYYQWRNAHYVQIRLLDINILKRKEKLNKLNEI
jgi:hypothetical protein